MNRKVILTILAGLAICSLIVPAQQAYGLAGAASLPVNGLRVHPDGALGLTGPNKFSVYTGSALPAVGWALAAPTLNTGFAGGGVSGTFVSNVYVNGIGAHLFSYQVLVDGASSQVNQGNVAVWGNTVPIVDCGVIDPLGDVAFDQGDVLELSRIAGQVKFDFNSAGAAGIVSRPVQPNNNSQVFYYETLWDDWDFGLATVQDGGGGIGGIRAYVPNPLGAAIPEPLTMLGVALGIGGLARYMKKRRRD